MSSPQIILDSVQTLSVHTGRVAGKRKREPAKPSTKNLVMQIRVTPAQKAAMERAAKRDLLNFSAWALRILLPQTDWKQE